MMDLISIRWIAEVINMFFFPQNELNMNTQVGDASRKVEKNSGPFGKNMYFNDPRLLIPNPTRVRGTRRSLGPVQVSGQTQVDP